ncbi:orotidine-5'-phosphate decarboxylase [Thermodesulfitimonas sp.]
MQGKKRLMVALDADDWSRAQELAGLLRDLVGGFKVGMRLYYRVGPAALAFLRGLGREVFADLKLHDIPSTVAGGVQALTAAGASIINVHAAGGRAMMRAAAEAAAAEAARLGIPRPKVVAVTVLTSLDEQALREEVGISESPLAVALRWALLAKECGLDGAVAAPLEAAAIKKACGPDFLLIAPGVRPLGAPLGDQRRVMTPGEAVRAGADYIVVGRPVLQAPDPVRAAAEIVKSLDG